MSQALCQDQGKPTPGYVFGVIHDLGKLQKQRGFLSFSGTPIKHGQQVKGLLTAILLASEIALMKVKAHNNRTEPEYQGDTLAGFYAKVAPTVSVNVVAHMAGPFCLYILTSCRQTSAMQMALQHSKSALESEKLIWANCGCKFNKQLQEIQGSHLVLLSSHANLIFSVFAFFHSL